ncbi:hypothetical protein V2G26_016901 [Clonostachys chloroleuca]
MRFGHKGLLPQVAGALICSSTSIRYPHVGFPSSTDPCNPRKMQHGAYLDYGACCEQAISLSLRRFSLW